MILTKTEDKRVVVLNTSKPLTWGQNLEKYFVKNVEFDIKNTFYNRRNFPKKMQLICDNVKIVTKFPNNTLISNGDNPWIHFWVEIFFVGVKEFWV